MNASFAPRRGLSLTEVLVAIFVMGLGMLSLLVLFPVGLSNMKWALQDNRLALAAQVAIANGEAIQTDPMSGRPFTLRSDPNYYQAMTYIPDPSLAPINGLLWWHPVPLGGYPVAPLQAAFDPAGPRPPVFVDSVGVLAYVSRPAPPPPDSGPTPPFSNLFRWGYGVGARKVSPSDHDRIQQPLLATGANMRGFLFGIPRIRSAQATGLTDAIRACVQEDELTFGTNAQPPGAGTGSAIEREGRYSWAYMCRFPKGEDDSVVDMTIVLYSGRKITMSPPGSADCTSGEQRYFGNPTTTNAGMLPTPPPPLPPAPPLTPATGLVFVKGSNEAIIDLYDPNQWNGIATTALPVNANVPSKFKKGDVILDNTLVMPEFTQYGGPPKRYYAPFDSQFTLTATAAVPPPPTGNTAAPATFVRKGLANGYFYKLLHVGAPELQVGGPGNGRWIQRLTLDRPALADGFEAVYLQGAVDIIEKSNGRMPTK